MTRVNNKSKYLDDYLNDKECYLDDKGKVESLRDKDRNSKSRFLSGLRKKIDCNNSQIQIQIQVQIQNSKSRFLSGLRNNIKRNNSQAST